MARCIRCGCTDTDACMTDDGPCYWVSEDPPICSACDGSVGAGGLLSEAGFGCEANTAGMHQPLFRGDGSAYCVHCRVELDTPEAA